MPRVPPRGQPAGQARAKKPIRISRLCTTASGQLPTPPSEPTRTELRVPAETHLTQGPVSRAEVFAIVRDRLADILEIEPDAIEESASFRDDLDADSLALIELVEAIEEELAERTVGFRIEDDDLEDLKTVRDAVDYVVGRLN